MFKGLNFKFKKTLIVNVWDLILSLKHQPINLKSG